jgi:hypothetical protein
VRELASPIAALRASELVAAEVPARAERVEVLRANRSERARLGEPVAPLEGSAPLAPPRWQTLADAGKYQQALELVETAGFARVCDRLSAGDLLRLADVARYAGHAARSREALKSLRRRFVGSEESSAAAFTLGRLAFDKQRQFAAAARWFTLYLDERPRGPLRREAMGRLVEAYHRASTPDEARRAARAYLAEFPSGAHATYARRVLE